MKTVKLFRSALSGALLLAGALFLGGCSQDDPAGPDDSLTAAAFTAGIQATRTTTGGNAWLATDKVGIFMLATGGSLTTPADVLADNVQYTVAPGTPASTAAFSPTSGTPIYYPQSGNVDFAAYYPYGTAGMGAGQINGYTYNITVAGQSTEAAQNSWDVLYAKTSNVAKSKTVPVALSFGHVLSKITLNVTLGDGLTSLSGADITAASFSGMPATATLALQDGTLTAGAAGDFSALKAATANAPAAATFTALLVPQTGGTGRTAVFTVDGVDYIWTIPDTHDFAAGQHYTYPVTVKLTGVTVGAPTITDWAVDATHDPGTASEIGAGIAKVKIPAGTFLMGSSDGSASLTGSPGDPNYTAAEPNRSTNETQHKVTLTKNFYMSKYQITNAQYAAFLNAKGVTSTSNVYNPGWGDNMTAGVCNWGDNDGQALVFDSSGAGSYNWGVKWDTDKWIPQTGYDNHPVIWVTWYGAYEYAEWAGGFLPTEAQWEYACRGGYENRPFGIGTGYELNNTLANFYWRSSWSWDGSSVSATTSDYGSYPATTQKVGSYVANTYGLYDMHGNVYEWCSDWYDSSYYSDPSAGTDPTGPASGSYRVLRGGDWYLIAQYCRSAYRNSANPDYALNSVGFRVAFVP